MARGVVSMTTALASRPIRVVASNTEEAGINGNGRVAILARHRVMLRTFVFEAAARDVFGDGRPVAENGILLHLDPERTGDSFEESQAQMLADAPRRDFLGRTGEAIAPRSLPL